jgi:hypothetical protein
LKLTKEEFIAFNPSFKGFSRLSAASKILINSTSKKHHFLDGPVINFEHFCSHSQPRRHENNNLSCAMRGEHIHRSFFSDK